MPQSFDGYGVVRLSAEFDELPIRQPVAEPFDEQGLHDVVPCSAEQIPRLLVRDQCDDLGGEPLHVRHADGSRSDRVTFVPCAVHIPLQKRYPILGFLIHTLIVARKADDKPLPVALESPPFPPIIEGGTHTGNRRNNMSELDVNAIEYQAEEHQGAIATRDDGRAVVTWDWSLAGGGLGVAHVTVAYSASDS